MVTIQDLNWAAGFLEGEGSFGCWRGGARGKQFVVCAEQVQREPLDKLQELFGGAVNFSTRGGRNIHRWRVSGPRARGVAMTLFSLLSTKRKSQIKLMLDNPWRRYEKRAA